MLSGVTGYRYGYIECCECFRNSGEMANKALKIAKNKVEETQQAYNDIHKIQKKTANQQKKEAQLEKELKI